MTDIRKMDKVADIAVTALSAGTIVAGGDSTYVDIIKAAWLNGVATDTVLYAWYTAKKKLDLFFQFS